MTHDKLKAAIEDAKREITVTENHEDDYIKFHFSHYRVLHNCLNFTLQTLSAHEPDENGSLEERLNKYRPLEDTQKATQYLAELCDYKRPIMNLPPEVEDWDMVFCRIISRCEQLDKSLAFAIEQLEKEIENGRD